MKWGMPVMTRSRFFFNSSVIRQNLRQHGWIGIIYMLGLMFFLPLQMFLSGNPNAEPEKVESLFGIGGDMQVFFIATLPVVAGLFLFRFLQSKPSSDLWHSLPLRREHLLAAHTWSGLILLLLPVWLTAAVTAIVAPLDGNRYIYQGADVWEWCLTVTLLTLFLFVFTTFVGICTGQTILQGVVVYILLVLPSALLMLTSMHLNRYLYGYSGGYNDEYRMVNWSPVLQIVRLSNAYDRVSTGEKWIYFVITLLVIMLSFVLYRKRHSEKAGQAIAFTYFNPLFKAGVMFCAMLVSVSYFGNVKPQQTGWLIGGCIAGALIGYVVAEMIIRKTWQIMTRRVFADFAAYTILLGLLLYVPVTGITGYESRVPAADKVTAAYAGSNFWMLTEPGQGPMGVQNRSYEEKEVFNEDKSYIEAVRKLHQALVTVRPGEEERSLGNSIGSRQFSIAYQLKNGRQMLRSYWIPSAGFEPELKAIMENKEFKRNEYMLSRLGDNVESLRISNKNKAVSISDPQEVKEFKEILKREILNMSYEDQLDNRVSKASIQTIGKPDETGYQLYYGYEWKPSYHELEGWLAEKGYADKIRTQTQDVESAEIIKDGYIDKLDAASRNNIERYFELARSEGLAAVTKDKKIIGDILGKERYYSGKTGEYVVKMKYKYGEVTYISLRKQDLTPAIKSLLP
ncbi:DUF6449 domain-containing protein [Paenibacillus sp. FSL L8-0436]|uniref:DUF6449 domain-containing protein n=1 Tax=Paenibacillus sp. FSL L8-0436 TaxID=2954686 RepID=UPI0031581B63